MKKIDPKKRQLLRQALREDVGVGDLTANTLVPAAARGRAVVIARESGILAGSALAAEIFRLAGPALKLRFLIKEGASFRPGQTLLTIEGEIRAILKAERTALNFLGHLSGIATQTRKFVDRVKSCPVPVLDTRKTTPLWRDWEKAAVKVGGGTNHRMGLYDYILVKENHRPYGELSNLKKYAGKFEIEVRNIKELKEALDLRPGVILFDNFSPKALKKAVIVARRANSRIILEASGGITLDNILSYAKTGVDRISVGSLTHSVKSANFSLLIQ